MYSNSATRSDLENSSGGKRILITEDSPVTQDILKIILSGKGHDVHIAHDGPEALKRLQEEPFDLALMDYHLPGLSGVDVVKAFLASDIERPAPTFVAMTADPEGLNALAATGGLFAKVFAKPFDFDDVLDYLDGFIEPKAASVAPPPAQPAPYVAEPGVPGLLHAQSEGRAAAASAQVQADQDTHPVARIFPEPQVAAHGYTERTLFWPADVGPAGFSVNARKYMASGSDYEAVVVTEPAAVADMHHLWGLGDLALLPIVDETGQLGVKADLCLPKIPRGSIDRMIQSTVLEFAEARASVHLDVRHSALLRDKLLASLYVRKQKLVPHPTGSSPLGLSYNIALDDEQIVLAAGELVEAGLLSKTFVDRVHVCRACRSVRLNAREECFECRSPNLHETAIVHHFKCAYQGPLEDFQQGSDLVCPKCARELRHFGVDYDKPGTVVNCLACKSSASDAAVGFKCFDCGAHTDGEVITLRDVHEYALTDKGRAFVEEGFIVTGQAHSQLRFAELPLDLVIALNKSARHHSESARPFCLVAVGYPDRRVQLAEYGARLVDLSRRQILENLKAYFGDAVLTHHGTEFDYLLVDRISAENFRANWAAYEEIAVSGLKMDLGPRMTAFGPAELFG